MWWLVVGAALAAPAAGASEDGPWPGTTPARAALVRALLPRHGGHDCAALVAGLDEPAAELAWVAASVPQPGWVALRAADCLATTAPRAGEAILARWLVDPATAGLARVVAGRLDAMPQDVALRLGGALVAGPLAAELAPVLVRQDDPELRALVDAQPGAAAPPGAAGAKNLGN